jgi:hypothetical protein
VGDADWGVADRGANPREADLGDADLGDADRGAADRRDGDLTESDGRPAAGWLRALVVGGLTVDVVLAAAVVSFLLPASLGDVVFRSPLLILVLIAGTALVLWTITRPRPLDR